MADPDVPDNFEVMKQQLMQLLSDVKAGCCAIATTTVALRGSANQPTGSVGEAETSSLQTEIAELRTKSDEMQKRLDDAGVHLAGANLEIRQLQDEISSLKQAAAEAQTESDEMQKRLDGADGQVGDANLCIRGLEDDIASAAAKVIAANSELAEAAKRAEQAENKYESLRQKTKNLVSHVDMQNIQRNYTDEIDNLKLQLKELQSTRMAEAAKAVEAAKEAEAAEAAKEAKLDFQELESAGDGAIDIVRNHIRNMSVSDILALYQEFLKQPISQSYEILTALSEFIGGSKKSPDEHRAFVQMHSDLPSDALINLAKLFTDHGIRATGMFVDMILRALIQQQLDVVEVVCKFMESLPVCYFGQVNAMLMEIVEALDEPSPAKKQKISEA